MLVQPAKVGWVLLVSAMFTSKTSPATTPVGLVIVKVLPAVTVAVVTVPRMAMVD